MRIDVVTIFPKMFEPVLGESLIKRALQRGMLQIHLRDLRHYTHDRHHSVDDRPYGGGPGMVMRPEPIVEAVETIRRECRHTPPRGGGRCGVVLMSPEGERLTHAAAQSLAELEHLIIVCGHYEGVDERVKALVVDRTVSIGDYVLTGGELPAMVLIDCVSRFVPGVIGHAEATKEESFVDGILEYPQYTRPPVYRDRAVPGVLRSGDHEQISRWRKLQAVVRTFTHRPDLAGGDASGASKESR